MRFAENNRISHRQLYRQIVLAFTGPLFLYLFQWGKLSGSNGIVAVCAVTLLLMFLMIFLIRLGSVCADIRKTKGLMVSILLMILLLSYIIFTAVCILKELEQIVLIMLIPGISKRWVSFLSVLACGMGIHQGMQRRGRIAEVTGILFLTGIFLFMLLSATQGTTEGLQEMIKGSSLNGVQFLKQSYWVLSAFSGIVLLPFTLEEVEKQGSAKRAAVMAVFTVGVFILGMLLIIPSNFGWDRTFYEKYPALPLFAQANLPGNILARFDVIWIGILIYSILFSLGSLFHYGDQVMKKCGLFTGKIWFPLVVWIISGIHFNGMEIEYYERFLKYFFVPAVTVVYCIFLIQGTKKWKKRSICSILILVFMIGICGCAGIDPEKRMYPLVMSVDRVDGEYQVSYIPPNMKESTGQEKPEQESNQAVTVSGSSFDIIKKNYDHTQEKYLDMGHLQILIFGKGVLEEEYQREILEYLKEEPFVGEDIYVFQTENLQEITEWKSAKGSTAGDYIMGILENKLTKPEEWEVTLREVYHSYYRDNKIIDLPKLYCEKEELLIENKNKN